MTPESSSGSHCTRWEAILRHGSPGGKWGEGRGGAGSTQPGRAPHPGAWHGVCPRPVARCGFPQGTRPRDRGCHPPLDSPQSSSLCGASAPGAFICQFPSLLQGALGKDPHPHPSPLPQRGLPPTQSSGDFPLGWGPVLGPPSSEEPAAWLGLLPPPSGPQATWAGWAAPHRLWPLPAPSSPSSDPPPIPVMGPPPSKERDAGSSGQAVLPSHPGPSGGAKAHLLKPVCPPCRRAERGGLCSEPTLSAPPGPAPCPGRVGVGGGRHALHRGTDRQLQASLPCSPSLARSGARARSGGLPETPLPATSPHEAGSLRAVQGSKSQPSRALLCPHQPRQPSPGAAGATRCRPAPGEDSACLTGVTSGAVEGALQELGQHRRGHLPPLLRPQTSPVLAQGRGGVLTPDGGQKPLGQGRRGQAGSPPWGEERDTTT